MASPQDKQVKAIQINIALGMRQRVDLLVDSRVMRDLCKLPAEHHSEGLTSIHPELIKLVNQIAQKLASALQNRDESITVKVDGTDIVPDP
jgi:hypothetical protein